MSTQTVFNRCEEKYLLSREAYEEFRRRLDPYMQIDEYGLHTICNIYFDTPDDALICRSLEKPIYKEKLRLRSYGIPTLDSAVFLEIKKKYKGTVNKRRIRLRLREAYLLLEDGSHPPVEDRQILREIESFCERYNLSAKLFLAYDRLALFGREDPTFRLTFDTRIRSRRNSVRLEDGDGGRLLLPDDYFLAESKIHGAAPVWFSRILAELSIFPVPFSKYGNVYKKECGRFSIEEFRLPRKKLQIDHTKQMESMRERRVC